MSQLASHPLYGKPAVVMAATQWHLDRGRSVFQMFQFPGGEEAHSHKLLEHAALPQNANVLSLGSGVGGMERYWLMARPDLQFELVNISAEQLAMSVCDGDLVVADAEGYISRGGPFDCVVLAYMLGHVDPVATLLSALQNLKPGGKLFVFDIFGSSPEFDELMQYESPKLGQFDDVNAAQPIEALEVVGEGLEPCEFVRAELPAHLIGQTTPALLIFKRAGR